MTPGKLFPILLSLGAVTAAAVAAFAFAAGPGTMRGNGGMMASPYGGLGGGGAGAAGAGVPTAGELRAVAGRIDSWLATSGFAGFRAAEVMAFTNNDYVAVRDARGTPAFELLTNLKTTWVMEEPPSMMWNTRYGLMGGLGSRVGPMMGGWMIGSGWKSWYGTGAGKITSIARAVSVANGWLAGTSPGEQVAGDAGRSAMGHFPGYFSFDTTRDGKTVGMVSVNASTGAVWYHAWHGTFLSELEL